MAFAYPGTGRQLNLSTGTSTTAGAATQTVAIPNNSYSEIEAIADSMKTQIQVQYAVAPGSATTVQFSADNTFANPTNFPSTLLPASADKTSVCSITEAYSGFIRVFNSSGQTISSLKIQKQVSTGY